MSDILVVYYSRTGSTRTAAAKLAEYLNCDLAEIISTKSFRGPFGWLAAGRSSIKGIPVDIAEPEENPGDYETVIVCSPVWASNVPGPVRTYLTNNKEKFKKISYLITMSAKGQDIVFKKMAELGGTPVRTVHFSDFERKSDVWVEKLTAYAHEVQDLTAAAE